MIGPFSTTVGLVIKPELKKLGEFWYTSCEYRLPAQAGWLTVTWGVYPTRRKALNAEDRLWKAYHALIRLGDGPWLHNREAFEQGLHICDLKLRSKS
jgi:hypothetical protein